MSTLAPPQPEAAERFACFGGTCTVLVAGPGPAGAPPIAVARVKRRLQRWHGQFSRFEATSELSLLNRDPRECVPVSPLMARFVAAALEAAALTGGLVDPTLLTEIEEAGYAHDFDQIERIDRPGAASVGMAPDARPAGPHLAARWREVTVDRHRNAVTRPVGVRFDTGGIAKGLFCDVLASLLTWHQSFAIEAAGDVRLGGAGRLQRPLQVKSPFDDEVLHTFELAAGAAATSGTTKRSWADESGRPAHHLLDPATGRPAFTGVVQATALAPSGVEAEARAKAALLAGRDGASGWLAHGGVVVYDDGAWETLEPEPVGRVR